MAAKPKTPEPYTHPGAALHAEKIAAQARKIERKGLVSSGTHRLRRVDLIKDAYCVIEKAFRIAGASAQQDH